MIKLRTHAKFIEFLADLKDKTVKGRVMARIDRMRLGLYGDVKLVGDGVWEARIDFGAGWRIYYTKVGGEIILLLGGGTKKGQQADIDAAKERARELKN